MLEDMRTKVRKLDVIESRELAEEERRRKREATIEKKEKDKKFAAMRLRRFLIPGNPPTVDSGLRDHSLGDVREKHVGLHLRSRPCAFARHRVRGFFGSDLWNQAEIESTVMAAEDEEEDGFCAKQ